MRPKVGDSAGSPRARYIRLTGGTRFGSTMMRGIGGSTRRLFANAVGFFDWRIKLHAGRHVARMRHTDAYEDGEPVAAHGGGPR